MVAEVTVSLKNSEKSLKKQFLVYEEFAASYYDPEVQKMIRETMVEFKDEIDRVKVKIEVLPDPIDTEKLCEKE